MNDPLPREIGESLLLSQRNDSQGGRGRWDWPSVHKARSFPFHWTDPWHHLSVRDEDDLPLPV